MAQTDNAAVEIEAQIVRHAPSPLSASVKCAKSILREFGLRFRAADLAGFTGCIQDDVVIYGTDCTEEEQFLVIVHEVAEHLAREGMPGLFDDFEAAAFDGSMSIAGDPRHFIAQKVELLICKRLGIDRSKVLPPRPQPVAWFKYQFPQVEIEYVPADEYQPDTYSWETQ